MLGVRLILAIRYAQSVRRVSSARTVMCAQFAQQEHSHVRVLKVEQMVATCVCWLEVQCTVKMVSAVIQPFYPPTTTLPPQQSGRDKTLGGNYEESR